MQTSSASLRPAYSLRGVDSVLPHRAGEDRATNQWKGPFADSRVRLPAPAIRLRFPGCSVCLGQIETRRAGRAGQGMGSRWIPARAPPLGLLILTPHSHQWVPRRAAKESLGEAGSGLFAESPGNCGALLRRGSDFLQCFAEVCEAIVADLVDPGVLFLLVQSIECGTDGFRTDVIVE